MSDDLIRSSPPDATALCKSTAVSLKKPPPTVVTPTPEAVTVASLPTPKDSHDYDQHQWVLNEMVETMMPLLELVWPELYYWTPREVDYGMVKPPQHSSNKGVDALLEFFLESGVVSVADLGFFAMDDAMTEEDQIWMACWQSQLTPGTFDTPTRLDNFMAICRLIRVAGEEVFSYVAFGMGEDNPDITAQQIIDRGIVPAIAEWQEYDLGGPGAQDLSWYDIQEDIDKKMPAEAAALEEKMAPKLGDDLDQKMAAKLEAWDQKLPDNVPAVAYAASIAGTVEDYSHVPPAKRQRID